MMRLLSSAHYVTTAWKNGRGTTTEILREPEAGSGFDFDWRVSVADVVEDGPFSTFPGIDRGIVVVEGEGMDLTMGPEMQHRLAPLEPFAFEGERAVTGRLINGPVRDFNVMVRRGFFRFDLDVLRDVRQFGLPQMMGELLMLHVVDGHWHGEAGKLTTYDLTTQQTLCLNYDRGASYVFDGDGIAVMVRVRPVRSW